MSELKGTKTSKLKLKGSIHAVKEGIDGGYYLPTLDQNTLSFQPSRDDMPAAASANLEEIMTSSDKFIEVQETAAEAKAIAEGAKKGFVFDTEAELNTWLLDEDNIGLLHLGDNLYIRDTNVPDYWWDGISKQPLEAKTDLTDYIKNTDYASLNKAGIVKVYPGTYGLKMNDSNLVITAASESLIDKKDHKYMPIVPFNLDYATKVGITTNTIPLTPEEQAAAQEWLGGHMVKHLVINETGYNLWELDEGFYNVEQGIKINFRINLSNTIEGKSYAIVKRYNNISYILIFENYNGNTRFRYGTATGNSGSIGSGFSDVFLNQIVNRNAPQTITGVKTFTAQPLMTAELAAGDSSTNIPNTQWVNAAIANSTPDLSSCVKIKDDSAAAEVQSYYPTFYGRDNDTEALLKGNIFATQRDENNNKIYNSNGYLIPMDGTIPVRYNNGTVEVGIPKVAWPSELQIDPTATDLQGHTIDDMYGPAVPLGYIQKSMNWLGNTIQNFNDPINGKLGLQAPNFNTKTVSQGNSEIYAYAWWNNYADSSENGAIKIIATPYLNGGLGERRSLVARDANGGFNSMYFHPTDGVCEGKVVNDASFKTINGQSILGKGDLTIGDSGTITIDQTFNQNSENAISGKGVQDFYDTRIINDLSLKMNKFGTVQQNGNECIIVLPEDTRFAIASNDFSRGFSIDENCIALANTGGDIQLNAKSSITLSITDKNIENENIATEKYVDTQLEIYKPDLTDYVKNTDYATNEKAGIVFANEFASAEAVEVAKNDASSALSIATGANNDIANLQDDLIVLGELVGENYLKFSNYNSSQGVIKPLSRLLNDSGELQPGAYFFNHDGGDEMQLVVSHDGGTNYEVVKTPEGNALSNIQTGLIIIPMGIKQEYCNPTTDLFQKRVMVVGFNKGSSMLTSDFILKVFYLYSDSYPQELTEDTLSGALNNGITVNCGKLYFRNNSTSTTSGVGIWRM